MNQKLQSWYRSKDNKILNATRWAKYKIHFYFRLIKSIKFDQFIIFCETQYELINYQNNKYLELYAKLKKKSKLGKNMESNKSIAMSYFTQKPMWKQLWLGKRCWGKCCLKKLWFTDWLSQSKCDKLMEVTEYIYVSQL